ncbi:hypothetical protein LshimejAT787_1500900 [Lyophyllum shimeji]|uniref:DUF6818 domain-containing protein n=1 Tax=Lyophyllum shimeji TaxID=47721 RepID=A0A9P3PZE0_LYOSH|nr:hypothetical protein LshimejAT787_1500900 [Lyophyllum shimeji]
MPIDLRFAVTNSYFYSNWITERTSGALFLPSMKILENSQVHRLKRKLGGSPDTSRLTVDDRPPKKCKLDTDPNVPYIIASSHLVEQHPGPPYGVKFELGCLVSGCIGNIWSGHGCQIQERANSIHLSTIFAPPNHQPPHFTPTQPAPPLCYDDAGNAFAQDLTGRFVPYYIQYPMYPPGLQPHGPLAPHDNTRNGPDSPISKAYTEMSVAAAQSSNSAAVPSRPVPSIDPRLAGLPLLLDSDDDDLTHGPTVAKAQGRAPAKKVASSRREPKAKQRASQPMNKGKARASEPISSRKRKALLLSDDEDIKEAEAKCGRPRGSSNYTIDEVMHLLDLLEAELPLGQKGWNSVYKKYTKWARNNNYISRTVKSLDTKYKQLIKTTMPTGDSRCPPDVKRAHQIEDLIKERACTRDLNDSGFDGDAAHDNPACKTDAGEEDDDDEVEIVETPSVKKEICHAIVRRPDPLATITRRKNCPHGMELVTKLADAFDPAAFKARDAERADRSLQNTQILILSQQLCDSHATIKSLRAQITNLYSDLHKVERACDRADMKLELFEMSRGPKHPPSWSRKAGRFRHSKSAKRDLERHEGHTRVIYRYPEGGEAT